MLNGGEKVRVKQYMILKNLLDQLAAPIHLYMLFFQSYCVQLFALCDYLFLKFHTSPKIWIICFLNYQSLYHTREQCKVKITAIEVNFGIVLSLVSINCFGTLFGISAFKFFSSVTFHSSFIHGHVICTYLFLIGLSNSLEAFIS